MALIVIKCIILDHLLILKILFRLEHQDGCKLKIDFCKTWLQQLLAKKGYRIVGKYAFKIRLPFQLHIYVIVVLNTNLILL